MNRKRSFTIFCLLIGLLGLVGCSSPSSVSETTVAVTAEVQNETPQGKSMDWETMVSKRAMELDYAENFSVDYYEGGYTLLTIEDGTQLLTIPEGMEVPENLDEDIVPLQQPLKDIYLVASATMDMFADLDALDSIRLSGQKEENWYIEEAREAMANGEMVYAGKYNKPDYELILANGCSLAIENMMISHSPEVIDKLEGFGIPVMIEYSSYESHPLGRVEWIKFFGALLGKEERAEELYAEQIEILKRVTSDEKTDKTVAFFFITSNGLVQVRRPSDYVPKMIDLAGGTYIYEELGEEDSARSTMNVQMEEFYNTAKDTDYLIYNSSIDGGVDTIAELVDKSELLADFKAVKEGNVWCTTNDMYQQSMSIGYLIEDMHKVFMDESTGDDELQYLYRVK
ncbi:MAG: ABC transporter substrate-binding protein [Lachnospiraceae bacterium]|nr:ABC transporter substrate-binding protein [Lachnospiraceae bacterium]